MKSTDLMIGDWVKYTYTDILTGKIVERIFRILRIENELGSYYVWANEKEFSGRMCHPEKLEPIKITPDFLIKNGFETEDAKDGGFVLCDDFYDIFIYEWSDSIWVARYESTEMYIPFEQATISYVHELQHFLKSNGIEKEIFI